MRQIFVILIVGLVWLPLVLIASYFLVFELATPNEEIFIVPAIEKPIKIRPINTSCMPFIKNGSGYSLEVAIPYEKNGNEWVRPKDKLNYRQLEDEKGDETVLLNVSEHVEKTTIDPRHSDKDKKVLKRASSLNIIMSCNNDI